LSIQEENDLKEKKSVKKQSTNEILNNDDSQDKLNILNILEDKLSMIMTQSLNADDIIDDDIIDMSNNSSKEYIIS
jgi:hypothetical protein